MGEIGLDVRIGKLFSLAALSRNNGVPLPAKSAHVETDSETSWFDEHRPSNPQALPILTGSATDGEMQNGLLGRFRPRMLLGIENGGRESTDDLGDISGLK